MRSYEEGKMGKKEIADYTQNRELSWLRFNERVLEEARDESVPLMERMKFVAIFTSNLDEFFMIRVGSLCDMAAVDDNKTDSKSGMTPSQQLEAIYSAVAPLYKERDRTYAELKRQLTPYGVCGLGFKELEQSEKKYVKKYFLFVLLIIPCLIDGILQYSFNIESNNFRRLISGILCGVGSSVFLEQALIVFMYRKNPKKLQA